MYDGGVVAVLFTLVLFVAVFVGVLVVGGIVSSIVYMYTRRMSYSGAAMQLVMGVSSTSIMYILPREPSVYGLVFSIDHLVEAIAILLLAITPLCMVASRIAMKTGYKPRFLPESTIEWVLLGFITAPVCEEFFFRGLLMGILYSYGLVVAVLVPAILFSVIHIIPYKDAPHQYLAILLITAFIMGYIAGYYRYITGSLVLAITIHSLSNLVGYTIMKLKS